MRTAYKLPWVAGAVDSISRNSYGSGRVRRLAARKINKKAGDVVNHEEKKMGYLS